MTIRILRVDAILASPTLGGGEGVRKGPGRLSVLAALLARLVLLLHPGGEACRRSVDVPCGVGCDHRERVSAAAELGAEGRGTGDEWAAVEAAREARAWFGRNECERHARLLLAGLDLLFAGDERVGRGGVWRW